MIYIVLAVLSLVIGVQVGCVWWIKSLPQSAGGLSAAQRDTLAYVQKLLNNYHAAHLQSPLNGAEIEELLRLCKDKVEEVLG